MRPEVIQYLQTWRVSIRAQVIQYLQICRMLNKDSNYSVLSDLVASQQGLKLFDICRPGGFSIRALVFQYLQTL
jgi:hypothetical protein